MNCWQESLYNFRTTQKIAFAQNKMWIVWLYMYAAVHDKYALLATMLKLCCLWVFIRSYFIHKIWQQMKEANGGVSANGGI